MQTLGELKLLPVWADAQHLAQSARLLMEGHELKVLPVLDAGTVVGLAHLQDVINTSLDVRVSAVMKGAPTALESNMTVIKAAQLFVERELDYAPVMRDGQLVGMLTTHHLLRELRRTWDPLTSLGWSDRLREWGSEKLRSGQEISILFIDIDQFGQYNKKHGHIVGDKVLIQFAKMLSNAVDPAQEILVRYGGDEFAIGTLRDHAGTMELARDIRTGGGALMLEEEGRPIGFTMGVSGGRRTEVREDTHISSMLDDLINLASKDCLSRKNKTLGPTPVVVAPLEPVAEPVAEAPRPTRPRFDPEA